MAANSKLVTYYQNLCEMRTKFLDFYNHILQKDFDLIIITETWLQEDVLSYELCDGRYDVLRCDRILIKTNRKGEGGVTACIKREHNAVLSWSCPRASFNLLCMSILAESPNNNMSLHIFVFYVPSYILFKNYIMIEIKSFINILKP